MHIGPTAFLGVELDPTYDPGGFGGGSGVLRRDHRGVLSGSPAAQAGLAAGDVIVSVDGQTVDSATELERAARARTSRATSVTIGWTDQSGARHSSTVQLATGPAA